MAQEIKHGIDLSPDINIKHVYGWLCAGSLTAAMVDDSWHRFVWAFFAFMLIFAVDKIKDAEKLTRKVKLQTENEMTEKMLKGWDASLGDRYAEIIQQISTTSDTLLKQLSTYVRDASPTRTDRIHICSRCQREEPDE